MSRPRVPREERSTGRPGTLVGTGGLGGSPSAGVQVTGGSTARLRKLLAGRQSVCSREPQDSVCGHGVLVPHRLRCLALPILPPPAAGLWSPGRTGRSHLPEPLPPCALCGLGLAPSRAGGGRVSFLCNCSGRECTCMHVRSVFWSQRIFGFSAEH